MPRRSETQVRAGADRKPDEGTPVGPKPNRPENPREPHPVSDLAEQLNRAKREASGKLEQVRQRIQHLAQEEAPLEDEREALVAETQQMQGSLEEGDVEVLGIMTLNQQSNYDVYADSHGPASTRPLEE